MSRPLLPFDSGIRVSPIFRELEESSVAVRRSQPRRAWVDYSKGLGILLVVFGHVWRGIHTAELPMNPHLFARVDAFIYSFHMPLFFFLSGLFIERAASQPLAVSTFAKLRALGYPYVVWTVLYGSANVALSRFTNTRVTFAQIFPGFIYAPYAHFWFLYALLGCSLLYLALHKGGLKAESITALGLAFYASVPLFGLGPWGVPYLVRSYFVYFAAGASFHRTAVVGRTHLDRRPRLAALLAVTLALTCAFAICLHVEDNFWAVPLLASVGIAWVISASLALEAQGRVRWLLRLGELSLPIYVAHTLGTAAARIALAKFAHIDALAAQVAGGMIGGLGFPVALHAAAERAHFSYLYTWPAPRTAAVSAITATTLAPEVGVIPLEPDPVLRAQA